MHDVRNGQFERTFGGFIRNTIWTVQHIHKKQIVISNTTGCMESENDGSEHLYDNEGETWRYRGECRKMAVAEKISGISTLILTTFAI